MTIKLPLRVKNGVKYYNITNNKKHFSRRYRNRLHILHDYCSYLCCAEEPILNLTSVTGHHEVLY